MSTNTVESLETTEVQASHPKRKPAAKKARQPKQGGPRRWWLSALRSTGGKLGVLLGIRTRKFG
jgi:hypothetical protein